MAVLCLAAISKGAHAQDTPLAARFTAEAPATWEAYADANRHAQGVLRSRSEAGGSTETTWKLNSGCKLVQTRDSKTGSAEIFASNTRYAFHLRSGAGGSWVLVGTYPAHRSTKAEPGLAETRLAQHGSPVETVTAVESGSPPLWKVVRAAETRLSAVGRDHLGGRDLILVRLTTDLPAENGGRLQTTSLWLDASRAWLPIKVRTKRTTPTGFVDATREHAFSDGHNPLPTVTIWKQEFTSKDGDPQLSLTGQWEWELTTPRPPPDDREFTLSAFGLPEPVGVVWPTPSRTWLWLAFGCGLFLLVAVTFGYLRRRSARNRAAPPAAA